MNEYLDKTLKPKLAKVLAKEFGTRCKSKDIEDFPEMLGDPKWSRCPVCSVYEKLDAFIESLRPEYTEDGA